MAKPYVDKQTILKEAGLLQQVRGELLAGQTDGSNRTFLTSYGPIADRDYDDSVDPGDVTAYVNGVAVVVSTVLPDARTIRLRDAPASGAAVSVDYNYSNVDDSQVAEARREAQDMVDQVMEGVDTVPYEEVPPTIRKIVKWYAAGLLLLQDYGPAEDNNQVAKNGDYRIKRAEAWLDKYALGRGETGPDIGGEPFAEATHEADIFETDYTRYSIDERFNQDLH